MRTLVRCTGCGTYTPRLMIEWTLVTRRRKWESVEGEAMTHCCLCNGAEYEGRECYEQAVGCCRQEPDVIYIRDDDGDFTVVGGDTPEWVYDYNYGEVEDDLWELEATRVVCSHCGGDEAKLEVVEVQEDLELDPRESIPRGHPLHPTIEEQARRVGGQSEAEALLQELNAMAEARRNA